MAEKIGVNVTNGSQPAPAPQPDPEDDPAVKAALIAAAAAVRSAEINREAAIKAIPAPPPAPVITVEAPVINMAPTEVTVGASRAEIEEIENKFLDRLTEQVTRATDMPINVNVEAPVVNVTNVVEPTPVSLEATIMPEITVTMPKRVTETEIVTDDDGNIVKTIQIEKDA